MPTFEVCKSKDVISDQDRLDKDTHRQTDKHTAEAYKGEASNFLVFLVIHLGYFHSQVGFIISV